jgi:hypothetical protein
MGLHVTSRRVQVRCDCDIGTYWSVSSACTALPMELVRTADASVKTSSLDLTAGQSTAAITAQKPETVSSYTQQPSATAQTQTSVVLNAKKTTA